MIVLDTHALVWWVSGDRRLSAAAEEAIQETLGSGGNVLVSAISAWEIALLVARGRMALAMDLDEWIRAVENIDGVTIVPVTVRVAVQSATLPGDFHSDPADRMIVALAREQNAQLVTADTRIHNYPHVRCVW